jgi:hypothetical protein
VPGSGLHGRNPTGSSYEIRLRADVAGTYCQRRIDEYELGTDDIVGSRDHRGFIGLALLYLKLGTRGSPVALVMSLGVDLVSYPGDTYLAPTKPAGTMSHLRRRPTASAGLGPRTSPQ